MATASNVMSDDDTWLSSSQPTTNKDGSNLQVAYNTAKGNPTFRTILRWDDLLTTPGIPAGSTITQGDLTLYCVSTDNPGLTIDMHRCTRTFLEAQATWNEWATLQNWTTPGGDWSTPNATGFLTPSTTGVKTYDIMNMVQDAIDNRAGDLSLILKLTNELTTGTILYAFQGHGSFQGPELELAWMPPKGPGGSGRVRMPTRPLRV